MKEKNRSGEIALIVILLIIVLGLVGYIIYDKKNNKCQTVEKENKKAETINLDVTSSEVVNLYSKLDVLNSDTYVNSPDYFAYLYRKDTLKPEKLPDDVIVLIGLDNALSKCGDNCYKEMDNGSAVISISKDEVASEIKRIFGDIEYKDTNIPKINCSIGGYTFSNDTYNTTAYGCGNESLNNISTRIVKAEKTDKEINIYVKVAFTIMNVKNGGSSCVEWNEMDCVENVAVYGDYNKRYLIEKTSENVFYDSDKLFELYSDKLSIFKYTFTKENNNYYFTDLNKID